MPGGWNIKDSGAWGVVGGFGVTDPNGDCDPCCGGNCCLVYFGNPETETSIDTTILDNDGAGNFWWEIGIIIYPVGEAQEVEILETGIRRPVIFRQECVSVSPSSGQTQCDTQGSVPAGYESEHYFRECNCDEIEVCNGYGMLVVAADPLFDGVTRVEPLFSPSAINIGNVKRSHRSETSFTTFAPAEVDSGSIALEGETFAEGVAVAFPGQPDFLGTIEQLTEIIIGQTPSNESNIFARLIVQSQIHYDSGQVEVSGYAILSTPTLSDQFDIAVRSDTETNGNTASCLTRGSLNLSDIRRTTVDGECRWIGTVSGTLTRQLTGQSFLPIDVKNVRFEDQLLWQMTAPTGTSVQCELQSPFIGVRSIARVIPDVDINQNSVTAAPSQYDGYSETIFNGSFTASNNIPPDCEVSSGAGLMSGLFAEPTPVEASPSNPFEV